MAIFYNQNLPIIKNIQKRFKTRPNIKLTLKNFIESGKISPNLVTLMQPTWVYLCQVSNTYILRSSLDKSFSFGIESTVLSSRVSQTNRFFAFQIHVLRPKAAAAASLIGKIPF